MTEILAGLLANYTGKVSIPEHLPLPSLVLYLFLEFDDEKHRAKQLTDLFYEYGSTPEGLEKLEVFIRQDKKSAACYAAAEQAMAKGEIEQYEKDYDFESFERDKHKIPEFYTVSFLVWAERTGIQIPQYITDELKFQIEYYSHGQNSRKQERLNFPVLDQQEFQRLLNEPLWNIPDALLYILGYKSNRNEEGKIGFLKYKARVKRLTKYILDAQYTGDLKLYGFDDHLVDNDQNDIEEKRLKSFYASRVKPKDFVTWLNGVPLDLPVIEQYITPDQGSQIAVETLPNKFGFENLLHPIIVKSSYQQYCDGHLRNAVCDSITAIFDCIREKTGLDLDGENLISHALSLTDPYIILSELTSESGRNDQKGFIQIFKGAYQGIRNPKAHSLVHNLTEQKAAQYLVLASLLARRIEEAKFPK